jgi:hypothetical protein
MSRGDPPASAGRSALVRARGDASGQGASSAPSASGDWTGTSLDPEEMEVDPAELEEFLSGDLLGVEADPIFKETLRQKLWKIVSARRSAGDPESGETS